MTDPRNPTRGRWAPWWAYVIPILLVNYLRQVVVPAEDVGDAVSVALFAATTALIAAVVTALYRRRR